MKLKTAPGLEVNIRSNGEALQEYEDEEPCETVRLIEATSGSNFAVTLRAELSQVKKMLEDHVSCEVRLDGKSACSWIYNVKASSYDRPLQIVGVNSRSGDREMVQKFVFGDLLTDDGPVGTIKPEDIKHLGEIQVLLRWVRKLSSRPQDAPPILSNSDQSLPEKCLKGRSISSRASYGKAEPTALTNVAITETPHGPGPFATFTFKYRSRRDLQIEGIIPRSPSPLPLEERDPNDLSPEEARELIRRMRTHNNNNDDREVKIKKEKRRRSVADDDEEEDDEEVEITEERTSKRARLSTDSGVELIDLTDD